MVQRISDSDVQDAATEVASTSRPTFRTVEALYPADFSPRLIALYQRIQRRGQEPLFPASWHLDFMNLPLPLFMHTCSDQDYAPIRAMSTKKKSSSEFRGKLAMEKLLRLGKEVRELDPKWSFTTSKVRPTRSVEVRIVKGIKRFIFWAAQDAMISTESLQSFITISTLGRRRKTINDQDALDVLTHKTTLKLRKLAKGHREAAHRMEARSRTLWKGAVDYEAKMAQYERALSTTVYGLAICGSRMVIVGLNVRSASYPLRTLLALDFSDSSRDDLWSVLASVRRGRNGWIRRVQRTCRWPNNSTVSFHA